MEAAAGEDGLGRNTVGEFPGVVLFSPGRHPVSFSGERVCGCVMNVVLVSPRGVEVRVGSAVERVNLEAQGYRVKQVRSELPKPVVKSDK